ncbi:MAG: hypothetical protein ACR2HP_01485, partial [Ilumatobacteraceae bacterium]
RPASHRDDMTSELALPDFHKYRYHFARLWWLPVALAVLFPLLLAVTGVGGGPSRTSSALLVPAAVPEGSPAGLFATVTPVAASVAVLQSQDRADTIAEQLGFRPDVRVAVQPTGVVEITASGPSASDAARAREAYTDSLVADRRDVISESIGRALRDSTAEADGLQARLDSIDDAAAELADDSAALLLAAIDRADVNGRLVELQARIAALESAAPDDFIDVRTASLTSEEGRAGAGNGPIRLVGAAAAGAFLGAVAVALRAYLDERVRTRADITALGLPAFSVVDGSGGPDSAGPIELAAAIRRNGDTSSHPRVGLIGLGDVPVDRVADSVRGAASTLQIELPELTTARSPAERALVAEAADGVVLLAAPGAVRQSDLVSESSSLQLFGTKLLGVALVAKDARRARRSS